MKKNMKSSSILLGGLFLLGAVCSCTQTAPDYASYVNPFIGTGGHGHTYPGAVVPNGMIQPSPDTRIYEWDACSGYFNPAKRNVLGLKNETCKNREKRNVLKKSHTRHFKATKKQSKTGCFYSF